nr:putative polyprotein [Tanacetum cinerariifolium]
MAKLEMKDKDKETSVKPMRYIPEDQKEFQVQIKELLDRKLIRPNHSPHSSPAFLVRKHAKIAREMEKKVEDLDIFLSRIDIFISEIKDTASDMAELMNIVGVVLENILQIRMELYIENQENRRIILNSFQNGPLVWPTVVEEDSTTRKKKYEELSVVAKLQADCDLKATKFILQGLQLDVYAIVNNHKVAKEIWDRVKLLMQGTKLSLQEKECKLYDKFDKFSFVKGETLYRYYWRFSQLINNMNLINMSMRQVQVNTKFRNILPP